MTDTLPAPASNDTWSQQLAQLRSRYRDVRPAILAALNTLILDPNINDEDAKARAALHGVRITAASLNAAKTLLSRMDAPPAAVPGPTAAPVRRPRSERRPAEPLDVEASILGFVEKLRGESSAHTERMRDAVRRAIAILQTVVD